MSTRQSSRAILQTTLELLAPFLVTGAAVDKAYVRKTIEVALAGLAAAAPDR